MPNDGRCREFGRCRADFSCSMTIEEYFETSPSLPLSYSGILWASEVHTRPMLCRLLQSARNLLSFVHAPGPAFVASSHARPSCPPPLLQLERAFVRTALRSRAIAHALREAPAPAHCALARRAQMCLRQGHPGPGGHLNPWMLVAPSTTPASSTSRCALPSLAHPLQAPSRHARTRTLIAPTRRSQLQLPLCQGIVAWAPSSWREGPPCILFCFVAGG